MPGFFVRVLATILILPFGAAARPQAAPVHVKVRAILVDKDLNQKPVPFLAVKAKNSATGAEVEVKTGLDGAAQMELAAGKYVFSTAKAVELGGKKYSWSVEAAVKSTSGGTSGGEQEVVLTNDNAKVEAGTPETGGASGNASGDLTALFEKLKGSIFTVRSEFGMGSGFLVDSSGLVVTNHHVVGKSNYLALQFDKMRKVPAKLLADNADKDIAILWVNPAAFPEAHVAPLAAMEGTHIEVGQRVFTIGNPFGREKVLTTGVISKVEKDSIVSDITINPGNSGGPLFTLAGEAAGIARAEQRTLAYIVPIAEARPLIEQAKTRMTGSAPPSKDMLPVEPADHFPADALKAMLSRTKMDTKPYFFDVGEFRVAIVTPPVNYFLQHDEEMNAARKSAKRSGSDPAAAKAPDSALEEAQDYESVVYVRVRPKFSFFLKVKFKNGFDKMTLRCNGAAIPPIEPGRRPFELFAGGKQTDTTFEGVYEYPPDAISPTCTQMSLEIFSEKDPTTPLTKVLDPGTVQRIWDDFAPYRAAHPGK
jgi:S1-C subfamily serine protease